ncbi:MAG: hypothetical protein ACREA7_09710 [Nitrosotalea sp.]
MLFDDHRRFVELCIDNLLWGNVTIDFSHANEDDNLARKITTLSGDMTKWITYRVKPDSDEFNQLTVSVYFNLIGARFSDTLQGQLRDRDHEQKIKDLEEDNQRLASIIADQKKQLDQLYLESPDKKNIRGIS